jgi:hypothetical protein
VHSAKQRFSALLVRGVAMVPAEIELRHIALQVLLAHVIERTDESALQQAEARLNRVAAQVIEATRGNYNAVYS